jgi:hypothetical protein
VSYLIRLFPKAWQERYGREFEALLEATPTTPSSVLDVVAYAARSHVSDVGARLRSPEGIDIGFVRAPPGKANLLALSGLFLALPSILFVTANVIEYQVGVGGFASLTNQWAAADVAPFLLLGLSTFGLAFATIPLLGVTVGSGKGSTISARVVLHLRARNVAVASLAVLAGSALLLYAVLENV